MSLTRIQTQRPIAKGRHQKPNTRWAVRENPPSGQLWGAKTWPGAGAGTAVPFAQWLFDLGLVGTGIAAGDVRLNNATPSAATHVFVAKTGMTGADPTGGWIVNDPIRLYYASDSTMWVEYKITVITSGASWWDYTVTYTGASGNFVAFPDNTPILITERTATPQMDQFDPGNETVAGVQAHVDALTLTGEELRAEIQRILDAERANKNRVTLVDWLDAKLGVI